MAESNELDLSSYPRFSLEERDRRWARVRELMRQRNCACIVAAPAPDPDEQAPARYLSQIGGEGVLAWVVFPVEGDVTAISGSSSAVQFFQKVQNWVTDLRAGPGVDLVAARINELGLSAERIGLANFQHAYKNPDGAVPYEAVRRLQALLPKATLYGENEPVDLARLVKGPEEIAFIERAVAANELAIQAMYELARPGLGLDQVWAEMCSAIVRATGAFPQRLALGADGPMANMPVPIAIRPGAVLTQEVTSRYQGYIGQSNHTIQVGAGGPAIYRSAMKAAIGMFHVLVDGTKPGQTLGDLVGRWQLEFQKHDAEPDQRVLLHTCGLGNDFPRLMMGAVSEQEASVVIEPGFVFTLKPWLRYLSGRSVSGVLTMFGDPVAVTEHGARRLGQRAMEPVVVGT